MPLCALSDIAPSCAQAHWNPDSAPPAGESTLAKVRKQFPPSSPYRFPPPSPFEAPCPFIPHPPPSVDRSSKFYSPHPLIFSSPRRGPLSTDPGAQTFLTRPLRWSPLPRPQRRPRPTAVYLHGPSWQSPQRRPSCSPLNSEAEETATELVFNWIVGEKSCPQITGRTGQTESFLIIADRDLSFEIKFNKLWKASHDGLPVESPGSLILEAAFQMGARLGTTDREEGKDSSLPETDYKTRN